MNTTENTTPKGPIKAVLFDLGDTLLNFGRIRPREIFTAGVRSSYDYLKSLHQPLGGFNWYALRNLLSLRLCRFLEGAVGKLGAVLARLKSEVP